MSRWSTSGCEKEARACDWEQNLSEAFGRLFYSHRKELFHIWHSNFELDESNSMGKEDLRDAAALTNQQESIYSQRRA